MTTSAIVAASCLLDWFAGDPEWLPHPVRLIGRATEAGEGLLRSPGQSAPAELALGGAMTAGVVALAWLGTRTTIQLARRCDARAGLAVEILLGWTCLATRNLVDESRSVLLALERHDLPGARQRLSRIVGRDTQALDETEVSRAVIETLAESACDGIVSPLTWMAVGGVPLAMAYKAVNTLDSMIGHADEHYFYFGKVAARLDDVANFLPARITALLIVLVSGQAPSAWRIWRRDGALHKSPNAGHPESAMAGALGVRLGGENTYAGERIAAPLLGAGFPPPTPKAVRHAVTVVIRLSLLAATAAVGFRALRK